MKRHTIVAIPVKNEETHIQDCLSALSQQTTPIDIILLLLNNCHDQTKAICLEVSKYQKNILLRECQLAGERSSAGEARRLALNAAAELSCDGVIMTTDADAVPCTRWVEKNLHEIGRGADAVCGMAEIANSDRTLVPPQFQVDEARQSHLIKILDEMDAIINPDHFDPWPRHQQNSGASIALRTSSYVRAGGAPHVPHAEDRALIHRLRLIDARIRHAPNISVTVSGRLEGRAVGGMAATRKRRAAMRDELTDEMIEPAIDAYRRASAKAWLRAARDHQKPTNFCADDLQLGPAVIQRALRSRFFGVGWALLEAQSPILQRRRVAFADLEHEIQQASWLKNSLHAGGDVAHWMNQDRSGSQIVAAL